MNENVEQDKSSVFKYPPSPMERWKVDGFISVRSRDERMTKGPPRNGADDTVKITRVTTLSALGVIVSPVRLSFKTVANYTFPANFLRSRLYRVFIR